MNEGDGTVKKIICILLCLCVILCVLPPTSLAADDDVKYYACDGCVINYDGSAFAVTCSGSDMDGTNYVLLVVKTNSNATEEILMKPGEINSNYYSISPYSILYMNQTAPENGDVSFRFMLSSMQDCVLLLGGSFYNSESPKVIGTIDAKGVEVQITGQISCCGNATRPSAVLKRIKTDSEKLKEIIYEDEFPLDSSYSVSGITDGNYMLVVSKAGHLSWYKRITVSGTAITVTDDITLIAGDANNNGEINVEDLAILITYYGKRTTDGAYADCDFNENTETNVEDLSLLISNFGKYSFISY